MTTEAITRRIIKDHQNTIQLKLHRRLLDPRFLFRLAKGGPEIDLTMRWVEMIVRSALAPGRHLVAAWTHYEQALKIPLLTFADSTAVTRWVNFSDEDSNTMRNRFLSTDRFGGHSDGWRPVLVADTVIPDFTDISVDMVYDWLGFKGSHHEDDDVSRAPPEGTSGLTGEVEQGRSSSIVLSATGGKAPYTYSIDTHPWATVAQTAETEEWELNLTPSISEALGGYSITVTVEDRLGRSSDFVVTATITRGLHFPGETITIPQGETFTKQLEPMNGVPPYTITKFAGNANMTVSSSGLLTIDSALVAGTYRLIIQITDSEGVRIHGFLSFVVT